MTLSLNETLNCILTGKILILGDSGVGKTSIFNKLIDNGFSEYCPSTIGMDFHSIEVQLDPSRLSTKLSSKLEKVVSDLSQNYKNKEKNKDFILSLKEHTGIADKLLASSDKISTAKLQLWDAAGQEKFRNIVRGYYLNSAVILLVFDLCNRASFEHLIAWTEQVLNSSKINKLSSNKTGQIDLPLLFLIGNKNDLDRTHVLKPINQSEIDSFCDHYNVNSYYSISAKHDEDRIKNILTDIAHELYFHTEFIKELNKVFINKENIMTIHYDKQLLRQANCCLLL
ncbi:MAG: Rab family GTPase [Candidatus Paceibacterota bacterium]